MRNPLRYLLVFDVFYGILDYVRFKKQIHIHFDQVQRFPDGAQTWIRKKEATAK